MSFTRKIASYYAPICQLAMAALLTFSSSAAHAQTAMLPPPDPTVAPRRTSYDLGGSVNNDAFKKSDKYVDAPQVDGEGVRHFSNGRHFDLSKVSLEDAIAQANASTLGGQQRLNKKRQFKFDSNGNTTNYFQNTGYNSGSNQNNFRNNGYYSGNTQNSFQRGGYDSGNYQNNNFNPRRSQAYVTDWGTSEVSALNNQNYRKQTDSWNGRRSNRNPRWNWD